MRRTLAFLLLTGFLFGGGWFVSALLEEDGSVAEAEPGRLPSEIVWVKRTFPYYEADLDAYRTAFVESQRLRATAKHDIFGAWKPVGPTNIGGRIADVEFDPKTPSVLYAAAATGGVFKSIDSGQSWQPIFDDQPLLTIGDIAIDPTNPQVLYVGTGEANGGHNNFAGGGLYKSTDSGATWQFMGLENTVSIGRIRVHPTNPQRVFLAAIGSYFVPNPERGLYRSDDGGQTWGDPVLSINDSTGVIDFVMRPDDPDVLFAAAWQRVRRPSGAQLSGPASGIYRSDDGGDTWMRLGIANGLPDGSAGRIGLAICDGQPDVMYALYTNGSTYQGFYRTNDGGITWFNADPDRELFSGFSNFSWYFGQVRVDPAEPDLVYVMDVSFMRSTNGGDTWTRQNGTHVDHHALAFHPVDPSFVVNGNDGGLAISQNSGVTWTKVADLPVTQFYEIGLDPNDPNQFYGGTQDNGTLRSNGPTGWDRILGGDGFYVIVDPIHPSRIYAESQYGALVRIDNGQTFSATSGINSSEKHNWSTPVVMDPNDPQVLYYGTIRVYRTEDNANSWQPISPDLTKRLGQPLIGSITTIAVAPTNTQVLYAGTDDGNVWVSSNRGGSWRDVTAPPLPFRWVTRLVVDPTNENIAYATFSGLRRGDPQSHVFRTTDQGQTWEDISSNLPDAPVNAFAVDPRNPKVLYAGTDVGAFASLDNGQTWSALGSDLPTVSVYDLKIYEDATQRFLVAGTHGRSMVTLDLGNVPFETPVALEDEVVVPSAIVLEPAYPNPFTTQTTVQYRLNEPATVHLAVFDVRGRQVATLVDGPASSGTHTASWEALAAPGMYLARLTVHMTSGTSTHTTMLTRVR